MNMMHYGDYDPFVDYDEDAGLFHGEIITLRDVVTFQGESVATLKAALAASVDDYVAFCEERGEMAEKPLFRLVSGSDRATAS